MSNCLVQLLSTTFWKQTTADAIIIFLVHMTYLTRKGSGSLLISYQGKQSITRFYQHKTSNGFRVWFSLYAHNSFLLLLIYVGNSIWTNRRLYLIIHPSVVIYYYHQSVWVYIIRELVTSPFYCSRAKVSCLVIYLEEYNATWKHQPIYSLRVLEIQ